MDRGQDGPQSRFGCCEEISYCSEKSNQHFSALLPVAWSLNRLSYPVSGNITAEQIKRFVKYRFECEYSLLCSIMIVILLSNSSPSQPDVAADSLVTFASVSPSSLVFVLTMSLCLHIFFRLLTCSVLQFLWPFLRDNLIFHTFAIYSFVKTFLSLFLLMYLVVVPFWAQFMSSHACSFVCPSVPNYEYVDLRIDVRWRLRVKILFDDSSPDRWRSRVILEKLIVPHPVRNHPAFYTVAYRPVAKRWFCKQ
jgi:hypothetical protein